MFLGGYVSTDVDPSGKLPDIVWRENYSLLSQDDLSSSEKPNPRPPGSADSRLKNSCNLSSLFREEHPT